jgi:tryptophan-rich sensory protein
MKIVWKKLIAALVIVLVASFIGSTFTSSSVDNWYKTLKRPGVTPPGWIFGPVWGVLYIMMGLAFYLVWVRPSTKKTEFALDIFGIQLVLNIMWSFLFFSMRSPLAAFIEIIFLWFFILLTIGLFYKISKPAAYLLVPYLLWVGFAANLNYYFWILN